MVGNSRDIATRSLVVALKTPCFGKTTAEVVAITGLPKSTVNRIYARAISRGFNPNQRPLTIRDCYVEDAHCGGAFNQVYRRDDKKSNREGMPRPIRKRKELCLYCQRAQIRRTTIIKKFSLGDSQGLSLPQDQAD